MPISIAHLLFAINYIRRDGTFDIIHDHNGFLGPMVFAHACDDIPPVLHTLHGPPFTTPDRLELGIPTTCRCGASLRLDRKKFFLVGVSESLVTRAPRELKPALLPAVYNAIDFEQFPFNAEKDDFFITLARFPPGQRAGYCGADVPGA